MEPTTYSYIGTPQIKNVTLLLSSRVKIHCIRYYNKLKIIVPTLTRYIIMEFFAWFQLHVYFEPTMMSCLWLQFLNWLMLRGKKFDILSLLHYLRSLRVIRERSLKT